MNHPINKELIGMMYGAAAGLGLHMLTNVPEWFLIGGFMATGLACEIIKGKFDRAGV